MTISFRGKNNSHFCIKRNTSQPSQQWVETSGKPVSKYGACLKVLMTGSCKPFLLQGKTKSEFCSFNEAFLRGSPEIRTSLASLRGLTWVSDAGLHNTYALPMGSLLPVPHFVTVLKGSQNDPIQRSYWQTGASDEHNFPRPARLTRNSISTLSAWKGNLFWKKEVEGFPASEEQREA